MVDVLAGVILLMIGFLIGSRMGFVYIGGGEDD